MANFSQLEFVSVLNEDSSHKNERIYELTIKMTSKKGGKMSNLNKKLPLTELYDAKGYLHRYIVKEKLDDVLMDIREFGLTKKNK